MAQPSPTLDSPSKLLELLQKSSGSGDEPPVEELLESLQAMQTAPPGGLPLPDDQLEVLPEPGFVIKTANEQGQKVFINVCSTSKLPMPPGWTKGQVPGEVRHHLEVGRGGEAPPSMRFPLSMGPPRLDKDHRGEVCMVLDCMVNPELLERISDYRPLKLFLIQLAMATAAQMTGQELNPQYKLPKMRYKGSLPPPAQHIRLGLDTARQQRSTTGQQQQGPGKQGGGDKPLIAEVAEQKDEAPSFALLANKRQQRRSREQQAAADVKAAATSTEPAMLQVGGASGMQRDVPQQPAADEPHEELEQLQPCIEYVGKPVSAVTITVALPAAAAAAAQGDPGAISTSVCAEAVRVQAPGCHPLGLQLPFAVSASGGVTELVMAPPLAGAAAGKASGSLVLTLPYRPFSSVLDELRQVAVAPVGGPKHGSPMSSGLSELD